MRFKVFQEVPEDRRGASVGWVFMGYLEVSEAFNGVSGEFHGGSRGSLGSFRRSQWRSRVFQGRFSGTQKSQKRFRGSQGGFRGVLRNLWGRSGGLRFASGVLSGANLETAGSIAVLIGNFISTSWM